MSEKTCTCTHRQGDAYYCLEHGGNGSWISLLMTSARHLTRDWDEDAARAVRAARDELPEGSDQRERVDALLDEATEEGAMCR